MPTKYYTKQRLKTAYDKGLIAFIVSKGLVVSFMFKNDPDTVGYLVTNGQNIRRFKTDEQGWTFIEKLTGTYI